MKNKIITLVGALLLACSLPLSSAAAASQPFSDVPPAKHFAEAVNDLAARNILGGLSGRHFQTGKLDHARTGGSHYRKND
ncbi:hypothetical protein NCCP2331_34330 [Sporosarcina sp. NCCP-2331]|nr:hypothetical protein NCCP2331_34330 [Sporosarcina sp. NCCP-2331]GLB57623.1 hypothetical protein NCCP2378_34130 [Sporosarcina sp. NCCP-2378]